MTLLNAKDRFPGLPAASVERFSFEQMAIHGKSNRREPAYLSESADDVQQVFLQSLLSKTFARVRNIVLAVNRIVVLTDKLGFGFLVCGFFFFFGVAAVFKLLRSALYQT